MTAVALRPYQADGIQCLRGGIRAGRKRQVLVAPTGSGKTEMACVLLDAARQKGRKAIFIVDRVVLVNQTSKRLDRYGISHGVIQAGHWRNRPYEHVQIASAQTLEMRGGIPADVELIIVDEAHCLRQGITAAILDSDAVVVGLTATPFSKGMAAVYDAKCVNVTTTNALLEAGFLVPLKMFAATSIDMAGAKTVAGEWSADEVEKRGNVIVGDIVAEWQSKCAEFFGGPVKTLVFAATVAHGAELMRQFRDAGHDFRQISYLDTSDEERDALLAEFEKPDSVITGLIACEILTKGFDVPSALCGISARPYRKSLSSHVQQLGRVMRPSPGKTFGLWLDHSGNALRFRKDVAELFANGVAELDDGKRDATVRKEPEAKERADVRCVCGCIMEPWDKACVGCGKVRASRATTLETVPGRMQELGSVTPLAPGASKAAARPEFADRLATFLQIHSYALQKHRGSLESAMRYTQANYKALYGEWPRFEFGRPCVEIQPHVSTFLRNRAAQFHIAKSKAARKPARRSA